MVRRLIVLAVPALLLGARPAAAQVVPLETAQGVVEKASKTTLVIQPRGAGGKFEKSLELKLVGTSKLTILVPQKKGGKVVLARRDIAARDLKPKQSIAVIYVRLKGGTFLLTGVAQSASK
jgi:hypothetical protein